MRKTNVTVLMAAMVVLVLAGASTVQAWPGAAKTNGNSCKTGCHTNVVTGKMAVSNYISFTDLGTQLDGKTRGSLKTFDVTAGGTATLSVDVLDGTVNYALQLKRLEKSGQQNSVANFLTWSESNAAWDRQESTNPPYFTLGIVKDDSDGTYTFDLDVDAATPVDVYDLEFAMAGKGGWYQDEHFYLNVVPEPVTLSLLSIGGLALLRMRKRRKASVL